MRRLIPPLVALASLLAGCGHFPPSPGEITQNYVSAIAEGNYAQACGMLDRRAQQALMASMHSADSCAALLARCLPPNAAVLEKDQAQLFYANVQTSINGNRATVLTSGTAVANRIRAVTFAKQHGQWVLVSYGKVTCAAGHSQSKRKRR